MSRTNTSFHSEVPGGEGRSVFVVDDQAIIFDTSNVLRHTCYTVADYGVPVHHKVRITFKDESEIDFRISLAVYKKFVDSLPARVEQSNEVVQAELIDEPAEEPVEEPAQEISQESVTKSRRSR